MGGAPSRSATSPPYEAEYANALQLVKDVEAGSSLGDSRVTEAPSRDGYNGSRSLTAAAPLSASVQLNTQVVSSLYYRLSWMASAKCQNWST